MTESNSLEVVRLGVPGARMILTTKSVILDPISEVVEELKNLTEQMVETLYVEKGVGLAAPQVGVNVNVFVMDAHWNNDNNVRDPKVFINPRIVSKDDEQLSIYEEACLSCVGARVPVQRSNEIELEWYDLDGKQHVAIFDDPWEARIIQHEMDHLDGTLIIDYYSKMELMLWKNKIKKIKRIAKKQFKLMKSYSQRENKRQQVLQKWGTSSGA